LRYGLFLASGLLAASIAIASLLSSAFMAVLAGYFLLNLTYTTYLKRKLLIDVLALAGSYTLRILAGNAATGIELSFWLLAFSIFLFFSLALVKRYVEMDTIGVNQPEEKRVMGRGYRYADLDMLSQMGVASAFSAVLVLALYVERAGGTGLYTHPELIWLICPIVMYVICRIWFLAKRGEMKDDPVEFILRDWRSHIMGLIVIAIMIAASW
jgi:4-hydroxybenzoate polyprenyltransferase